MVRHAQNSFSSLSTPSLDRLLELSPHAPFFIAEVPPLLPSIHLGPRGFSSTNPYPIVEVALAIRLQAHAEKIEEDT